MTSQPQTEQHGHLPERSGKLAVGVDMSISRQPFAGSSRWAFGLVRALSTQPDLDILAWPGPDRIRRGGPARKLANMGLERYWFDVAIPRLATRSARDVLLMPVNLTARASRTPQVVTILDVNFLTLPGTYDPAYARYARWQFGLSARRATRITTISSYSRTQIAQHLGVAPERISVVYPGLEPPPPDPVASLLQRPYGLYVGATEPHKDVPSLLRAWPALHDLDLDLVIAGKPGRDHARVTAMAVEMGERAHVLGQVTDQELDAWYQNASVFVFPSRTEGFGYPPLEAMQRHVPVVAADSGSLPEVLGAGALYHAAGDHEEIAAQIRRVMTDSDLRRRQVAAGIEVSSSYTWSRAAAQIARELADAVERP